MIATKSAVLPEGATITAAELEAASNLISFIQAYLADYTTALANISNYDCSIDCNAVQVMTLADLV